MRIIFKKVQKPEEKDKQMKEGYFEEWIEKVKEKEDDINM